jgi:hypothetical protein
MGQTLSEIQAKDIRVTVYGNLEPTAQFAKESENYANCPGPKYPAFHYWDQHVFTSWNLPYRPGLQGQRPTASAWKEYREWPLVWYQDSVNRTTRAH